MKVKESIARSIGVFVAVLLAGIIFFYDVIPKTRVSGVPNKTILILAFIFVVCTIGSLLLGLCLSLRKAEKIKVRV